MAWVLGALGHQAGAGTSDSGTLDTHCSCLAFPFGGAQESSVLIKKHPGRQNHGLCNFWIMSVFPGLMACFTCWVSPDAIALCV